MIEIAKIRSKAVIAEKVKFEFCCVLPGVTAETILPGSIYSGEPRLAVTMNLFIDKVKGKMAMHETT